MATTRTERPLTRNIGPDRQPLDLAGYERAGGYEGLRRALGMAPADVTDLVKRSGLRGRGGAGFPTGTKWSFVPARAQAPGPRYVVANADEMEPGTFKDRLLLEGDPHGLLEGMMIAAHAIEAEVGYVFLRDEYERAALALERALDEAHRAGRLGPDALGPGRPLALHLHRSAGRYMCGEETGLLNALEGRRAHPRTKPPYPQVCGLWGRPTVVNNVETLSNLPAILAHGPEWFGGLSRTRDAGTKLYGVSGRVKLPGLWELPMGVTTRELIEEHAGGMADGVRLRGVLPGGASTDFLVEEHLDLPLDFDGLLPAGSRLGTGTAIVLDDRTCPVGMLRNLEHFFAQESCGWCTPCWSGLGWAERILAALEEGEGRAGDLETLERICGLCAPGHTFCALAPGAVEPLQSALRWFRDDFERHVRERRCPWR
jgi:NADH-quinone oxidoreductase subunit F